MIIVASFTISLADGDKNLVPKDMVHVFKWDSIKLFVAGALFLVTALPFFFTTSVGGTTLRTPSGRSPCSSSLPQGCTRESRLATTGGRCRDP